MVAVFFNLGCCRSVSSNVSENLFSRETHLGRVCILVGCGAITDRGDDGAGVTLRIQTENLVVLCAVETFHWARINAEQGSAGKEITESDIGLVASPCIPGLFIHALH